MTGDDASREAVRAARALGATDVRVLSVRLTTYIESVRGERHGKGQSLHPDREVYVVHLEGAVTTQRGPVGVQPQTFTRTFWVIDATTGELFGWGSAP